eukprot:PhM_4_TR385/c2_g1_i4/m.104391
MYHAKLGWSAKSLTTGLWGDYTFDAKKKRIVKMSPAAVERGDLPMFARFILQPLWDIFDAAMANPRDTEMLKKVSKKVGVDVPDSVFDLPQRTTLSRRYLASGCRWTNA